MHFDLFLLRFWRSPVRASQRRRKRRAIFNSASPRAAWFIGASAGQGTLTFGGRNYPIAIGGLSAGLVFGGSVTDFRGTVTGIRTAGDIEGVYTAIGAGAAAAGGVRALTLRNARGVTLRLTGAQVGLMLNLDLSGMTITLR